jgi:16S rRNA (guanine966-N2)-methyltransferase
MKNEIRIIGGKWRGRKIRFAARKIRPTTDFVRETLFNWLMPFIEDAVCLDLFAGSGALGFEALSRGADKVVMMDQSSEVIKQLQQNAQLLQTDNVELVHRAFTANMSNPFADKFDLVFLDPPFNKSLVPSAIEWLLDNDCLQPHALIYIESEITDFILPAGWHVYRKKTSGQVRYQLWQQDAQ